MTVAADAAEPEYNYVKSANLLANRDQFIVLDTSPDTFDDEAVGYDDGHIED